MTNAVVMTTVSTPLISPSFVVPSSLAVSMRCVALRWWFTSNVFALLGLQQLYFLLGELLDKLVYLPLGLSVVLGFIGVKLIMEALQDRKSVV